jgi:3-hydroxyisobutyrate dehydrogenase-like beta-hydroxyacid dehydrogenase
MKVGWIGAGRMGSPMAQCAARAGHEVRIYAAEVTDEAGLRAAGASFCASLSEAVRDADLVCLCLFSDAQAREVMLGPDPAIGRLRAGAVLAVHLSGSAKLAHELAAAAPAGVRVLDAPFSGQVAGELTLLVGGERAAFDAARPVFAAYAKTIIRVGELGAAQRMKLVNQLLFKANLAAADEALRVLEGHGLSRAEIVPALMACSGASFALGILAGGQPISELGRALEPYFDAYLAAARDDALPIERLLRRGDLDP